MSRDDQIAIESPIQRLLERLHARHAGLRDGQVATYIPELAKADPEWFGICLATTDGHVYEVGDTRQPFTIQSISKPFVYGLALEDRGRGGGAGADRRGADRRRLQLDQPGAGHRAPAQSDDQRRRDRRHVAGRRALRRGPAGAAAGGAVALRRPSAGRSTPRSTSPSARPATATAPSATCCATSTSSPSDPEPRSTCTSSSARSPCTAATWASWRRRWPTAASIRSPASARSASEVVECDAERHDHLRHVRLRRRMDVPRRHAGQERRLRRHPRRAAGAARHRRLLPAPRCARQQRARHRGVPRPGPRARSPPPARSPLVACHPAGRTTPWAMSARSGCGASASPRRWTVPAAAPTSTSSRAISRSRRSSRWCSASSRRRPRPRTSWSTSVG